MFSTAIDQRVTSITKVIQNIVKEIIPIAKLSQYAKPYWTTQCSEAVKNIRKARRRKKAQIKRAKTIGWRAVVSEASRDPTKIWKLAKWVRKDPEEKQRLRQLVDIKDAKEIIHTEPQDLARAMAEHFFPQPVVADTEDISGSIYPEELDKISNTTTRVEVEEIFKKLPSDKAPGPDEIPNRFQKMHDNSQ
ncbi:hypothetical protein K3495_g10215 [Podosphaera aphanis]|nr:hypothetical protein K3495_g10215 [Podosphaera aphanis]